MADRLVGVAGNVVINGFCGPTPVHALVLAIDCCLLWPEELGLTVASPFVEYLERVWPTFGFHHVVGLAADAELVVALLEHRVMAVQSASRQWDTSGRRGAMPSDQLRSMVGQAKAIIADFVKQHPPLVVSAPYQA